MRRMVLAIWFHKRSLISKSFSNSLKRFCFLINFSNCKTFHIVSWPAYICTFPPKCFLFHNDTPSVVAASLLLQQKCGKSGWGLRLPVDSAPTRCGPLSFECQTEFICKAHISVFLKESRQVACILRLLAFASSDIQFAPLYSFDFQIFVVFSFLKNWFQSIF